MKVNGSGAVKRAQQAIENWSSRGSSCPLCHKDFRNGCNHTVEQSIKRLEQNLINAMIDQRLKQNGLASKNI